MKRKSDFSLFYLTAASLQEAETLAQSLLEARLIACANILPAMTSIYRWEGKTTRSQELVLFLKSKSRLAKQIEKHVVQHHSYTVPCVLEVPLSFVAEKYGRWLENEMTPGQRPLANRHDRRIRQSRRGKKKPVKRQHHKNGESR